MWIKGLVACLLASGATLIPCRTLACGWDNDTLSTEAKGLPELLDAIIGRVPIYPHEYYDFRIARSSKIVAREPGNFDELDNLIVAYDKIGNDPQAFHYAELKRKALVAHPNKEHEYRYYANLGTIEAHAWIRGNNHSDKSLLDKSIQHLQKCIEINPDAHFGREIVQLKLIELIRENNAPDSYANETVSEGFLPTPPVNEKIDEEWQAFVKKIGRDKVQKGIIGMMTLGGGPDSPDLLCAMIPTLDDRKGTFREVALRRIDDLWKTKPLFSGIGYWEGVGHPADRETFHRQYAALVENTKQYRNTLNAYVIERVNQGRHPDVDAHFWDDWREPKHVDLRAMEPILDTNQKSLLLLISALTCVFGLPIAFACILVKISRKYFQAKRTI